MLFRSPLPEIMTASNENCLKGIAKLDNRLIILLDLENALSDDDILKLQAAVDASSKDSHTT